MKIEFASKRKAGRMPDWTAGVKTVPRAWAWARIKSACEQNQRLVSDEQLGFSAQGDARPERCFPA